MKVYKKLKNSVRKRIESVRKIPVKLLNSIRKRMAELKVIYKQAGGFMGFLITISCKITKILKNKLANLWITKSRELKTLLLIKDFPNALKFMMFSHNYIKKLLRPTFVKYIRPNAKYRKPMSEIISEQQQIDYYEWQHSPVKNVRSNKCFVWFVPDWSNVWGGGHYTLFRFANHFSQDGTRNIIFIYNDTNRRTVPEVEAELKGALKNCKLEVIIDPKLLPECDAVFATTWQSTYDVRAFPYAKKKFYFMQDYESQFYAYGTQSMQANNSYKFGFIGITGGTWLRQIFESYGGIAENYVFSTDKNIFYPPNNGQVRDKVSRLFFYGRPSTERRCFELGIASLSAISKLYPDVEIVTAGLNLKSNLPFNATSLGNLTLEQTGKLYRNCDVGMAFSGTNLSYLPVELMASGCPVLTNNGPQSEWYCTKENSVVVDPVISEVVKGFDSLYKSKSLRQSLVTAGLEKSANTSWEKEMDKIYAFIRMHLV